MRTPIEADAQAREEDRRTVVGNTGGRGRRCACGRSYDLAAYLALPAPPNGDRQDAGFGEWLILRQCACGSTIAAPERETWPRAGRCACGAESHENEKGGVPYPPTNGVTDWDAWECIVFAYHCEPRRDWYGDTLVSHDGACADKLARDQREQAENEAAKEDR